MPYQVIYSSHANQAMSVEDLAEILDDARAGNETRGVTGALVFVDGVFLQILEGDKDTVLSLMRSIAADSRHSAVKVFHEAEVDQRAFGSWRMAYLDASAKQLSEWLGLPGSGTIEFILADLDRDPTNASKVAAGVVRALLS
jgi:hypothetical protein